MQILHMPQGDYSATKNGTETGFRTALSPKPARHAMFEGQLYREE